MNKQRGLLHLTATTEDRAIVPLSHLSAEARPVVAGLASQLRQGEPANIMSWTLHPLGMSPQCAGVAVHHGGVLVATLAWAHDARCGAPCWEAFHGGAPKNGQPPTPWLVTRIEAGAVTLPPEKVLMLADLSECLAIVWPDTGGKRRTFPGS